MDVARIRCIRCISCIRSACLLCCFGIVMTLKAHSIAVRHYMDLTCIRCIRCTTCIRSVYFVCRFGIAAVLAAFVAEGTLRSETASRTRATQMKQYTLQNHQHCNSSFYFTGSRCTAVLLCCFPVCCAVVLRWQGNEDWGPRP